jgi:hypothetical protein
MAKVPFLPIPGCLRGGLRARCPARCVACEFAGAPHGREAMDAAVRIECRRPASEGRRAHPQSLLPPFGRRFLSARSIFFLCIHSYQFQFHACYPLPYWNYTNATYVNQSLSLEYHMADESRLRSGWVIFNYWKNCSLLLSRGIPVNESRSCSCPSPAASKVATVHVVRHAVVRYISSIFARAPYRREALDVTVRAESRRPASEGPLGLVHDM